MVKAERPVRKVLFRLLKINIRFDIGKLPDLESIKYKVQLK